MADLKGKKWMVRIGNFVEESVSKGISNLGQEAPTLVGEPQEKVWYQLPVPEGRCADGSEYHIYVKKGTTDKLCVFFSGGGIAINEFMAARPVTGGRVAAWLPNYYWNNLRPFTQTMNINVGITANLRDNPFEDWNFLIITYATGDMHVGNCTFTYHEADDKSDKDVVDAGASADGAAGVAGSAAGGSGSAAGDAGSAAGGSVSAAGAAGSAADGSGSAAGVAESAAGAAGGSGSAAGSAADGSGNAASAAEDPSGGAENEATLYFHGYQNFMAAMRAGKKLFPTAQKLLIAGESAGAFAVPALAEQIVGEFYPGCRDVTLFSDSAQLIFKGWKRTLRDVWQVRRELWEGVNGSNLALEWYRGVCHRQGRNFRYLYSGSVTDYLLSAFYNDVTNKVYDTDTQIQEIYYEQMRKMIKELRALDPAFTFFIHDWHRPLSMYKGGAIHTVVRQPEFFLRKQDDVTMAYWLSECVEGRNFNVGMGLLR